MGVGGCGCVGLYYTHTSSTKNGPPMHHFGRIKIEVEHGVEKYRCTPEYTANFSMSETRWPLEDLEEAFRLHTCLVGSH